LAILFERSDSALERGAASFVCLQLPRLASSSRQIEYVGGEALSSKQASSASAYGYKRLIRNQRLLSACGSRPQNVMLERVSDSTAPAAALRCGSSALDSVWRCWRRALRGSQRRQRSARKPECLERMLIAGGGRAEDRMAARD